MKKGIDPDTMNGITLVVMALTVSGFLPEEGWRQIVLILSIILLMFLSTYQFWISWRK